MEFPATEWEDSMEANLDHPPTHTSWNKGHLVGQKALLKLKEICAIRTRLN
jgi:hypothetical protein